MFEMAASFLPYSITVRPLHSLALLHSHTGRLKSSKTSWSEVMSSSTTSLFHSLLKRIFSP